MNKIKIGQIGLGHNHSDKLKAIRRYPELFDLVGYAEENEEWIARRAEKPAFAGVPRVSVEEILEKCDAVLVETDVWNLTKTAQLCVDAGRHVHMDKPACGTLEEYKHLLDTAREKNLVLQLGYMYRYNPNIEKIFHMVRSGQLGDIYSINGEMSTLHSDKYRSWLNNFRGGNMYIFGSHLIDLIVYLLGKPNAVQSHLCSSGKNGVESTDLSSVTLLYDNAIARVFVSSVEVNGWGRRVLSVAGKNATVELRPIEEPARMTWAEPASESHLCDISVPMPVTELTSAYRYDKMLTEFHDYVLGIEENPFNFDHEYAVQEVLWEAVGGVEMLGRELERKL